MGTFCSNKLKLVEMASFQVCAVTEMLEQDKSLGKQKVKRQNNCIPHKAIGRKGKCLERYYYGVPAAPRLVVGR